MYLYMLYMLIYLILLMYVSHRLAEAATPGLVQEADPEGRQPYERWKPKEVILQCQGRQGTTQKAAPQGSR